MAKGPVQIIIRAENFVDDIGTPVPFTCCALHRGMPVRGLGGRYCCGCTTAFQRYRFTGRDYPVPRSCSCSCHNPCEGAT